MKKTAILLSLVIFSMFIGVWIYLEIPFVSDDAVNNALETLKEYEGNVLKEGTLMIVDFSRPSHTKRFAIMDLKTGLLDHYCRVAHGKNSGVVYAEKFSNKEGSLRSSLGLFKVTGIFNGRHGSSLRLMGLEPGKNDNALVRGIIVHAAPYVSRKSMLLNWKQGFRLGRSAGCFVLSDKDFGSVCDQLSFPAYLYAYASRE